ncbi:hypothetical protein DES53_104365 [Roseimicrobium gellanilyticum]|uniref:Uncharacterized protein n=2 Tax=Roseimicrobium gellanilyticum TaxID=748857 RepID=A0A366HQR4_9BACT|nr:hypothetical protein DES53_104365 [Roseimicrobium gellanilyticum]
MNDESSNDEVKTRAASPWLGWTLGLLAVPVLYFLTLPAVVDYAVSHPAVDDSALMKWYFKPYSWIHEWPLTQRYHTWYLKTTGLPTPYDPVP